MLVAIAMYADWKRGKAERCVVDCT